MAEAMLVDVHDCTVRTGSVVIDTGAEVDMRPEIIQESLGSREGQDEKINSF